jgi:hypothetical protein
MSYVVERSKGKRVFAKGLYPSSEEFSVNNEGYYEEPQSIIPMNIEYFHANECIIIDYRMDINHSQMGNAFMKYRYYYIETLEFKLNLLKQRNTPDWIFVRAGLVRIKDGLQLEFITTIVEGWFHCGYLPNPGSGHFVESYQV